MSGLILEIWCFTSMEIGMLIFLVRVKLFRAMKGSMV